MGETIEQRGRHLGVGEDAGPFAKGKIGGDDNRGALDVEVVGLQCRLLALSVISLLRSDWVAFGCEADMRTVDRSNQSDVNGPQETLAAQDFRSAKALFVPSVKRDIVPLLRAHDLRREGRMAI